MKRLLSFFLTVIMYLFPAMNLPKSDLHPEQWNTNYPYIFTHGLNGWGEYSIQNAVVPYWGTLGGSLIRYLQARGVACRSAFTDPNNSADGAATGLFNIYAYPLSSLNVFS